MNKTLLALTLLYNTAQAAEGYVEIIAGNENLTTDVFVSGGVAPNTSFTLRNTTDIGYDRSAFPFSVTDLKYNVWEGLSLLAEGQEFAGEISVRTGLEYITSSDQFFGWALATVAIDDKPNFEFLVVARYIPHIAGDYRGFFQAEDITNIGANHNFSLQRLRVGMSVDGYAFGAAANLTELEEEFLGYNLGGFLMKEF